MRKERTELSTIVRNAVDTARPFIDSRGHSLVAKLPQEAVYLEADPTRLAQVFSNLLNNAAKYTDPGGRIQLTATRDGDSVTVKVTDNGIGIAPGMQQAIFDMFTQVDHSLERTQAGLGVGLTLAKRLIELHGGTLRAHSDGLNRGSEFAVTLPVAAAQAHVETAAAEAGGSGDAFGHRILVADDNVDFATSFALILRMLGNEVRVAHDGAEALEIAGAVPAGILLPRHRPAEAQWLRSRAAVAAVGRDAQQPAHCGHGVGAGEGPPARAGGGLRPSHGEAGRSGRDREAAAHGDARGVADSRRERGSASREVMSG